jgi:hypothetical protein
MAKGVDCVQDDGFPELVKEIRWANGVVLGAPTYILNAAGSIHNMNTRFFRSYYTREFEGKLALPVSAAGRQEWANFALPQGSMYFLFTGMTIIDRITGNGQGPGEVFYDETACQRALESGAAMARGETQFRGDPGTCPECHLDLVVTRPDGSAYCILCGLPGQWVKKDEAVIFEPDPEHKSRFAPGEVVRHYEKGIFTSVGRFQSRSEEIKEKRKKFQEGYPINILGKE